MYNVLSVHQLANLPKHVKALFQQLLLVFQTFKMKIQQVIIGLSLLISSFNSYFSFIVANKPPLAFHSINFLCRYLIHAGALHLSLKSSISGHFKIFYTCKKLNRQKYCSMILLRVYFNYMQRRHNELSPGRFVLRVHFLVLRSQGGPILLNDRVLLRRVNKK